MRPLSLRIKGFTAFRDEQELDFSDLDLFALWGPTGSGKSSVLDAITYALYGQVERVGTRASQLVSQGQPRMAVSLDFVAGEDTYRVTRSTPASGATSARLEVHRGSDFQSYGEHADQVRAVNAAVKEIVGLDYEAFTRSVILPQGKFAEFLTGEAKNRRRILTELLGLELFKRMAQRANEISKDARINAEVKSELLARDYDGIDESALAAAESEAAETDALAKRLAKAETKLEALCKKWGEATQSIDSLDRCALEIADLATVFAERRRALEQLAESLGPLEADVTSAATDVDAAATARETATAALDEAVARDGGIEDLLELRHVALAAEKVRAALGAAERSLAAEKEKEAAALEEVAASKELLEKAGGELAMASAELAEREAAHERAHDDDKVGALVAGLAEGDPCPVCERPLERLPDIPADALEAAKQSLVAARAARESADRAVTSAEKDLALAESALATARAGVARCTFEVAERRAEIEAHTAELSKWFDGAVPDDAAALLATRVETIKSLASAVEAATKAHAGAVARHAERARTLDAARALVAEERAALAAVALKPAFRRAVEAAPKLTLPDPWPLDAPSDARGLAALAGRFHDELTAVVERLERARDKADAARAKLIADALAALPPDLEIDVDDLEVLVASVRDVARRASEAAALAKKDAHDLAKRLALATALRAEVLEHETERELYKALGAELKDDRIVEFLQEEALQVLAGAATHHLYDLSGGRYKLDFAEGDFSVVDAWNGDERRSVTTLSGGETFLASLSLALALAEQIQLLAVSERSKLDSLFLDEGFGTLDAETLEVVVTAIEQLGGGDRLVGVITHVPELAERLPMRLEVTKSPRGSVVSRRVGLVA